MTILSNTHSDQFFINGKWVSPIDGQGRAEVYNPNNGMVMSSVTLGGAQDTEAAIAAAKNAFASWSRTTPNERADLLEAIGVEMEKRRQELVDTVCAELGCPRHLTERFHVAIGIAIWQKTADLVRAFPWQTEEQGYVVRKEALGPIGVITPWNGPVTSIAKKVAAVLGAGSTAVSKPSENTPFSAILIAEAIEAAGAPAGVFNMLQGLADPVGKLLSSHKDISGITLTGSVGAGCAISKAGSDNLKRMCLELGGKSANIILDDGAFADGVKNGTIGTMLNSGQVCFSPTRMLVPSHRLAEAEAIATAVANSLKVGHAEEEGVMIGPVISAEHMDRIVEYINIGDSDGAKRIAGGPDRPEGLTEGYFVRPTVFSNVTNDMRIAREEIFGPVLSILAYETTDQAIEIANDTEFGLAAHVTGEDREKVLEIAGRLRAGSIYLNGATMSFDAPFGGYKMSGQGREHGFMGLEEFLETKAIVG